MEEEGNDVKLEELSADKAKEDSKVLTSIATSLNLLRNELISSTQS